ncbi:MAG TPA: hypothetical protein VLE99_05950 [Candidatus Saccharimonadales bacterium]|nr:hypothetical protein [Candidatus Saccharimonadales bacterium]
MGRSVHPHRGARTNLRANREIQRATREGSAPSFGVRRDGCTAWAKAIVDVVLDLQKAGDIPGEDRIRACNDPGVTLLGQRVFTSRLRNGRINTDQIGRVRSELARVRTRRDAIPLRLGEISVVKNRIICAAVVANGEPIGAETDSVYAGLVTGGIKGVERVEAHLTVAVAVGGQPISREAQADAIAALTLLLPKDGEGLPWRTYPDPDVFGS